MIYLWIPSVVQVAVPELRLATARSQPRGPMVEEVGTRLSPDGEWACEQRRLVGASGRTSWLSTGLRRDKIAPTTGLADGRADGHLDLDPRPPAIKIAAGHGKGPGIAGWGLELWAVAISKPRRVVDGRGVARANPAHAGSSDHGEERRQPSKVHPMGFVGSGA